MTSANTSDQEGFRQTFVSVLPSVLRVVCIYADRGYRGRLSQWLIAITGAHCLLKVIQPVEGQKGFAVQPKRWIIERTISWLNWSRRLSKDYEQTVASSQAWIDLSTIRGNLRKVTV